MELVLPLSRPRWQSRIFCSRWCTILYCTVVYCTVLYCTVLYSTVLYCTNLGIQCVRKKDIAEALKLRQEIRVDPYRQGFGHVDSPNSIDLNAVKLCFQVENVQCLLGALAFCIIFFNF